MKSPLQATIFFHDDSEVTEHRPPVLNAPAATVASIPPAEEEDPYTLFTVQIRLSTYQRLKQAKYWEPGFGELREHVDQALVRHLATLPGSNKPLPAQVLAKSKKLNKK